MTMACSAAVLDRDGMLCNNAASFSLLTAHAALPFEFEHAPHVVAIPMVLMVVRTTVLIRVLMKTRAARLKRRERSVRLCCICNKVDSHGLIYFICSDKVLFRVGGLPSRSFMFGARRALLQRRGLGMDATGTPRALLQGRFA